MSPLLYFFSPAADVIDREAFVGVKHPARVNPLQLVNKIPLKFLTTLVHLTELMACTAQASGRVESKAGRGASKD